MAGYVPWGAAGAAAAKRANAAALARHVAKLREEYAAYRAEERACGYDPEPFEEWMGPDACRQCGISYKGPRERAEERVMGGMNYAEWNRVADMF